MSETKARGSSTPKKQRPALTQEARERQIIALATDEAQYQIENHKASSQVLTHFLKLGSSLAELEKQKLINENRVLEAKAEAIKSAKASEELYAQALDAMRTYSGHGGEEN